MTEYLLIFDNRKKGNGNHAATLAHAVDVLM